MVRTTVLIIFLLSFLGTISAQHLPLAADSVYRYKWEVSTDVLWLFNRNTVPYSALLRIHKANATAYRLRLGGNYHENINPYQGSFISGDTLFTKRRVNLFMSVGQEWQKQYNQFRLIYGSDIFVRFNHMIYIRTDIKFEGFVKDLNLGLSPFVGAQYFIHPRLSLSTETHINLAYRHSQYLRATDVNTITHLQDDKYIRVELLPFYVLNVSYHF